MALFPMMGGSKKDQLYGGPCIADLIEQEFYSEPPYMVDPVPRFDL